MCDFAGFKAPEMIKRRPVVIISPNHLNRPGLVSVVPLSTTPPDPVESYHYLLKGSPIPGDKSVVWAKCDMVCTICVDRLDRIKLARGQYKTGNISMDQVRGIRAATAISLGIVPKE